MEEETLLIIPINGKCRIDDRADLLIDLLCRLSLFFQHLSENDELNDLSFLINYWRKRLQMVGRVVQSASQASHWCHCLNKGPQQPVLLLSVNKFEEFKTLVRSVILHVEKKMPHLVPENSVHALLRPSFAPRITIPIVHRMFHALIRQCLFPYRGVRMRFYACRILYSSRNEEKKRERSDFASKARSTRFCTIQLTNKSY